MEPGGKESTTPLYRMAESLACAFGLDPDAPCPPDLGSGEHETVRVALAEWIQHRLADPDFGLARQVFPRLVDQFETELEEKSDG